MKRLQIDYTSESVWMSLRASDITATKVSALFGCNPWLTYFELWHQMKTKSVESLPDNELMEVGRDFEEPIAKFIAKKEGWKIEPKKHYMRLDGLGIGSSFDFEITEPFKAIFEIKNVSESSFKNNWKEDGEDIQAPLYQEFQFQHELLVSGADMLIVGAMVGGNRRKVLKRLPDPKVHDAILKKCAEFWDSIKRNDEPKPDFERDAAFIAKLFNKADKTKEVFADDETNRLAREYELALENEKSVSKQKEIIKAKILMAVGDVGKVNGDGYSISLGETKATSYTVERKAGRNFRIYFEKEKEEQEIE